MNRNKKLFIVTSLNIAMMNCSFADDIEIYTGKKSKDANVNIIFMLDTSTSMKEIIKNTNETRMEQASNALKEIINQLPNEMRVGLGRFNDPGGSILTPARRLDESVDVEITKSVKEDAYENTDSKFVDIDNERLIFNSVGADIDYILDSSKDMLDARQCENGAYYNNTGQYLTFGYENVLKCYSYEGFHLTNIQLNKGSVIKNVDIELTSPSRKINNTKSYFYYEDTANPKPFPPFSAPPTDPDLITARTLIKTPYYWDIKEEEYVWQFPKIKYADIGMEKIFQSQLNKPEWEFGKSGFNFYLKSDKSLVGNMNTNQFYSSSYEFNEYIPKINITTEGNKIPNIIALRFTDIHAPSQSSVEKGLLKLIASENNGSGKIKIRVEKGKISEPFKEIDGNISKRPIMDETLEFDFVDWNENEYRLFDIKSLLSTKFESDWCGGGDITLFISSLEARSVYSAEYGDKYNEIEKKPKLIMEYDGGNEDSCVSYNGVTQIENANDDSNQREIDTGWYEDIFEVEKYKNTPYSNYIYLDNKDLSGYVFRDVDLPSDVEITEAYIQITAAENSTKQFKLNMFVDQNKDYPISGYSNKNNHLGQKMDAPTMKKVSEPWVLNGVTNNVSYKSPNIKTYIQNVIKSKEYKDADEKDRGIEIGIEAVSRSPLKLFAYDHTPSKSAKLIIKFNGKQKYTKHFKEMKLNNSKFGVKNNDSKLTVRQHLIALLDEQPTAGETPLEGALYEVGQYYLGNAVDYGRSRNNNGDISVPSKRISGIDTYKNGIIEYPIGCNKNNLTSKECSDIFISGVPKYITPMTENTCEMNNIILITDGEPTSSSYTKDKYVVEMKNYNKIPLATLLKNQIGKSCSDSWGCAGDLVSYLYNTDFMESKPGKSNILTHIIGYTKLESEEQLRLLAKKGGGVYNTAHNTQELVNSLSIVISNIMDVESTLATPGVAVNQNNRLQNLSDIYYSVFKPTTEKSWKGNLKKYKLNAKNTMIVDQYDKNAVNPDTGFFEPNTTSFWSNNYDGGDVLLGGAANKQTLNRSVYTFTGDEKSKNINLNSAFNRVSENNASLTRDLFGLSDRIEYFDFVRFLKWLRGIDVLDENLNGSYSDARKSIGDPLHSRPVLVNYKKGQDIVFVSTNDGFLHAIDAETGLEKFAFIPKELLKNSYDIYQGGSGKHIYGLDSSWVAWRFDKNKDGEINKSDGDFIYLYSGMRRGGDQFYALDVTDINNPILKFIKSPKTDKKYINAGQSWSEPVLGKVLINGVEKVVIIISGGYDQAYDNKNYMELKDSSGNQLYMLDAITGDIIWWASDTTSSATTKIKGMQYSIVSKPTMVDLTGNGYIDNIYITDLASQIIKFNVNNNAKEMKDFVSGKIIAKFGKTDGAIHLKDTRMMFDNIAIAPVKDGDEKYMAIVAGTGYRAHPLNADKSDIIVMIKDKEFFSNNNNLIETPIILNDLVDITTDLDPTSIKNKLKEKDGYYIKLKEDYGYIGEKATGEPLIYDNQIILNTYIPNSKQGECSPVIGYARSYRINVFNGTPINPNPDSSISKPTDRYIDNITTGIANGSKLIYTSDGVFLLTNTKIEKIGEGGKLGVNKKSWRKEI